MHDILGIYVIFGRAADVAALYLLPESAIIDSHLTLSDF